MNDSLVSSRVVIRNGFALECHTHSIRLAQLNGCIASLRNCLASSGTSRDRFSVLTDSDMAVILSLTDLIRHAACGNQNRGLARGSSAPTSLAGAAARDTSSTSTPRDAVQSLSSAQVVEATKTAASATVTPPRIHEISHSQDDIESQCWSRDGKLFALANQHSVELYDAEKQFQLIGERRLYFLATDVEIVRVDSKARAAIAVDGMDDNKTTATWTGYIVAVAGADGLHLFNYSHESRQFTVRARCCWARFDSCVQDKHLVLHEFHNIVRVRACMDESMLAVLPMIGHVGVWSVARGRENRRTLFTHESGLSRSGRAKKRQLLVSVCCQYGEVC
jgi:hypothetical protein